MKSSWVIVDKLAEEILFNRKGCIVEIGMGETTIILAKHAEKFGVKLYSCDIKKRLEPLFKDHIVFIMTSFEFMKQFDDKPAIVLLDGCHDYDIVKKEYEFFLEKMIDGGVMFLHDTYPPEERFLVRNHCSDSYQIRQELETKRKILDCFTWPYTANNRGLTMVLKKPLNRPFFQW